MPTKTDSIRSLFMEKGFGLMPTEAVKMLKDQGVKVDPQQVSTVKYQMKRQGHQPRASAARNERRRATANGVSVSPEKARAEPLTLTWSELEEVKGLLKKHGKAKLLRLISILAD